MSSLSCDGNVIEMTRQRLVHLEGVPGLRARAEGARDPVDSVDAVDSPVGIRLTADDC